MVPDGEKTVGCEVCGSTNFALKENKYGRQFLRCEDCYNIIVNDTGRSTQGYIDDFRKRPFGNGVTHLCDSFVVDTEHGPRKFMLKVDIGRTFDPARCKDCGSVLIPHFDTRNDEVIYECPDNDCETWTKELNSRKVQRLKDAGLFG